MKITPYHNQVVIKEVDESETMYGNIIVPDSGKEKPIIGIVIAVGPGIVNMMGNLIPMTSKVGKKVILPSFGGQKVTVNGEEFLIYKDQDIFGDIEIENKDIPTILPNEITKKLLDNTDEFLKPFLNTKL